MKWLLKLLWKWWQTGKCRWRIEEDWYYSIYILLCKNKTNKKTNGVNIESHQLFNGILHLYENSILFLKKVEKHLHRKTGPQVIIVTCLCYLIILQWDRTPLMSVHAFCSHISVFKRDIFPLRKHVPIQTTTARSRLHLEFTPRTPERANRPTFGPQK